MGLLLRWVLGEANTLADVALQSLDGGLEQRLLGLVDVGEGVEGLLGSGGLFAR
jgi:hypothetical protein